MAPAFHRSLTSVDSSSSLLPAHATYAMVEPTPPRLNWFLRLMGRLCNRPTVLPSLLRYSSSSAARAKAWSSQSPIAVHSPVEIFTTTSDADESVIDNPRPVRKPDAQGSPAQSLHYWAALLFMGLQLRRYSWRLAQPACAPRWTGLPYIPSESLAHLHSFQDCIFRLETRQYVILQRIQLR